MRRTLVATAVAGLPGAVTPTSAVSPLVERDERTPSMADWCERLDDGSWRIFPGTYWVSARGDVMRFERKA